MCTCRTADSTLTAVGRSQLLARRPGTHSRILSGIPRAAQTVLGVYLKRTCSRVTSASSALGVLNDYALYKSTHSLTHSLTASLIRLVPLSDSLSGGCQCRSSLLIARFHYTGPTGPARTFLRLGSPRNSAGSVRVSDKVRAGPVGSGRARVVEFSLNMAGCSGAGGGQD